MIVQKVYKYVVLATQGFLVLIVGAMTTIVIVEVVLRYGFNTGFSWSEELSRFLFIAITFIGASEALRKGQHASVSVFIDMLPNNVREKINFIVYIFMLLFLQVLYTLTEWKWVKTLLGVFFVIHIALSVFF